MSTRAQLAIVSAVIFVFTGVTGSGKALSGDLASGHDFSHADRNPLKCVGFSPCRDAPRALSPTTTALFRSQMSATHAQSSAQPNPSAVCTLRVHVDGFRNTIGNLGTILFTSRDGWPEDKQKSFRHGPAPIDKSTRAAVAVWPLPPGDYAVAAIHDENSNAKLDRNLIGIPKEGFGFANNPHVGFSAPPFEQAVVHVACPVTDVTIHLQYR